MTTTDVRTTLNDTEDAARQEGDALADETRSKAGQVKDAVGGAIDQVPDMLESARSSAERAASHLPEAADRARLGVQDTTSRLQTLPDSTLRVLAAASIGLAAGLQIAGAPRLVTLAAIAPALLAGGAMATRSR